MKRLIVLFILGLQASLALAQKEKSYIVKGNELYGQQKYKEAEENYRKSVGIKERSAEGNFNLGNALYKQKNFAGAAEQFNRTAASAAGKEVAAKAYHNLGNSLLSEKKLQESIEAYKKSLLLNPKDDQTRYNLAYAQQLLKNQQQQQNKDNKDKQNQDQNNKDKQDKDQQNKDQDKKKDQQNNDQQNNDQQNQDKDKGQGGQQPQPGQLSKEDAERMLEALNNQEQATQDKLKDKKLKGAKVRITKDW